ncbi:hypothetical protein HDV05_005867 [Chytridiales sp. JEL 0842]|nr:hypothetical protein HDV05_005867 [Chytridiales sp. JEL 0842]
MVSHGMELDNDAEVQGSIKDELGEAKEKYEDSIDDRELLVGGGRRSFGAGDAVPPLLCLTWSLDPTSDSLQLFYGHICLLYRLQRRFLAGRRSHLSQIEIVENAGPPALFYAPPAGPPPPSGDPNAGLPPGWSTQFDPATGRTMFINHTTGISQYEDPRYSFAAPPPGGAYAPPPPPVAPMSYAPPPVPAPMSYAPPPVPTPYGAAPPPSNPYGAPIPTPYGAAPPPAQSGAYGNPIPMPPAPGSYPMTHSSGAPMSYGAGAGMPPNYGGQHTHGGSHGMGGSAHGMGGNNAAMGALVGVGTALLAAKMGGGKMGKLGAQAVMGSMMGGKPGKHTGHGGGHGTGGYY